MAVPFPLPWQKNVLLYVRYLFLEYSCNSLISSALGNDSYLHCQSSVLLAFKICFDQIFAVEMFVGAIGFNRRCNMTRLFFFFFKVYAMQFLMWLPLRYNSKLAKSISLFLNPYPFIQKLLKSVVNLYIRNYFYPKICINDICM